LAVTRRPAGGRLLAFFLTDLIASVAVVLMLGWLIQASASDDYLRDAMVAQNDIYVSITRFTPRNLAMSYVGIVGGMNQDVVRGYDSGADTMGAIQGALVAVAMIIVNAVRAVPGTIIELYHETSGPAAWIVLVGFGVGLGGVYLALLGTRASLWRLFLAVAVSPFAISVVFVGLQGFMIAMLDMFYWFTVLAPYTVICPAICTLYWIAFPNAERGAAATVAHALLRVLDPKK
jgi:hypothetical protein